MNYRENPAVNWSTLKEMKNSALEYRLARDFPREETDAMRLGTLIHCGLLEANEVDNRYLITPQVWWKTKEEKLTTCEKYAQLFKNDKILGFSTLKKGEFLAEIKQMAVESGKIPVPESSTNQSDVFTWEKAEKIIKGNKNKPAFVHMWGEVEKVEQEMYGTCEITGLELKGLIDIITTVSLCDLKTIGTLGKMYYNLRSYSYLGQIAFYDYLLRLNGIMKKKYFICFVETSSPYKMRFLEIEDRVIHAEHDNNIDLLKKVKHCQETDNYSDGSEIVELYEYREEEGHTMVSDSTWLEASEQEGQDTL